MALSVILACLLPTLGAAAILHPFRKHVSLVPPEGFREVTFAGDGVTLHGWSAPAIGRRRGTVIYLHGVSDNRVSGVGVMERFRQLGFDVVAYDSRAHGESSGDTCSYGCFEKEDLARVIAAVKPGPVVLIGSSLGAAVALQEAGRNERVTAVVAAESFSDFKTVARERAPSFLTDWMVRRAFSLAEEKGGFQIDSASPVIAASSIKVPVLLVHGADDTDTPPTHAQRIFNHLKGVRKMILVPGARHNESLGGNVWPEIVRWIGDILEQSDADGRGR
ncbi:hypothetical protein GCM10023212_01180 [Luteolibacter yonseiensis]